jgi:hypothetical protein
VEPPEQFFELASVSIVPHGETSHLFSSLTNQLKNMKTIRACAEGTDLIGFSKIFI